MDSLYVCLFSNGLIKVGRSSTPNERIKTHRDRVACVGLSLDQSYVTECPDNDEGREQALLNRCCAAATKRHQLEWFEGLSFDEVCRWAYDAAHTLTDMPLSMAEGIPNVREIAKKLRTAGYTQWDIARFCGCGQSSISDIASGKTLDPSYSVGAALIRLAQSVQQIPA